MRIVLLDDLPGVGNAGEVAEVKNGYARNWLLPQGLAERATKDALNRVTLIKRAAEAKRAARMTVAAEKFGVLAQKDLILRLKTGAGSRVFGAVTSTLLAQEAKAQFGIDLDRRHIMLDEPIKQLGEFTIPLRASSSVTGELRVNVLPELKKGQTAEQQARQLAAARAAAQGGAAEAATESEPEAAAEGAGEDTSASEERIEEMAEAVDAEA
jgi:large subunit ribosomal protein L9